MAISTSLANRARSAALAAAMCVLVAGGAAGAAAAAATFPSDEHAASLAARAAARGKVHVIAGLRLPAGKFSPEGALPGHAAVARQRRDIARAREALIESLGAHARAYASWSSLPYVALEVNETALAALSKSSHVTTIAADELLRPSLSSAMAHIGADLTFAGGYGGAGQTIVIADSGIDRDHPFFDGRIVGEACFSAAVSGVSLCPNGNASQIGSGAADALASPCLFGGSSICDHGVHVSGIAAGRDPGAPVPAPGGIDGVAPDASIVAIQVFTRFDSTDDCDPSPAPCIGAWTSDIMSALDHVHDTLSLSWDVAAVNLSLGGGMFTSACDGDALKPAIDNLLAEGIATVVASGNDGWTGALGSPACVSTAVAVGSATDPSDVVSSFTNMHAVVDLLAPGRLITSSVPDDAYATFSGTSMAAPVVTGALAVLRAAAPNATVGDLVGLLQTTGVTVTDTRPAHPSGAGTGVAKQRLQLDDALQQAVAADCGNGVIEFGEACDGADPGSCPTGVCDPDCTCEDPICGNDIVEEGESCDGLSDASCPGDCGAPGSPTECLCPDPDDCATARIIPALPYNDVLDTTAATIGAGDPVLCGSFVQPQGHSVWYRFVADAYGIVTADTFGSSYDTVLAALDGTCGSASVVACNDDEAGLLQSEVSLPVAPGESYFLEVTDYGVNAGGLLMLNVDFQPTCGSGTLDGHEECDDGNLVGGDCCAADCTAEPPGGACDDGDLCTESDACTGTGVCAGPIVTDCDDQDPCSRDSCLGGGACLNEIAPALDCALPGKAAISMRDDLNDAKDVVKWKWQKGSLVTDADLGAPTADTAYGLCIYDETAGVPGLYLRRLLPGGGPAWVDKGPGKGVQYKDKLGVEDGFVRVQLKPGAPGRPRANVQLKGVGLALNGPNAGAEFFDQDARVIVQLVNDTGACWTSEFVAAGTRKNDGSRFIAKTP